MKTYNEMSDEVFRRINESKNKKKKSYPLIISGSCLCLSLVLAVISGGMYLKKSKSGDIDKKAEKTSMKTIEMIHTGNDYIVSEFVDFSDLPPEGYDENIAPEEYYKNIGVVLAYKMSISDDVNDKFSVLFYSFEESFEQINEKTGVEFDEVMIVSDPFSERPQYLSLLTTEQIMKIAENGITCRYVGSGKGELSESDLQTREGREIFCERHGDQMVFSDESRTKIICRPDLIISDEIEKYNLINNSYYVYEMNTEELQENNSEGANLPAVCSCSSLILLLMGIVFYLYHIHMVDIKFFI